MHLSAERRAAQDRYRELNNTMREFTFVRGCRRSKQTPKLGLPSRSLAALCPACPQPGINMRAGWKNRAEEYKYVHLHFEDDEY